MKNLKDVIRMDVSNISFENVNDFGWMLNLVAISGNFEMNIFDMMMIW